MDLLNTSRFRLDLLTQVFVLMFVSLCEVNTAQSTKMAAACYGRGVCNQMTLSCKDQQVIRLVDQQYNYVKNGQHCNTSGITNTQCNQYSQGNCCVIKNETCMAPVSKVHILKLFETCSGKQTCSTQATQGPIQGCTPIHNILADSNFLTYDCDNDTDTVQLCSNMSHTSNSINVIFNGTSTMTSYTTSQTCSCYISSSPQYHAYFQDVRSFRPNNTSKCSSISLNGTVKMCNGSKKDDFIYQSPLIITNHTITARNLFSQGPDDRPTMVWIRIKTNENIPLTVTCTGKTTPTVGRHSTTKSSSGSASSTTTKPSSGSASSTTTKPNSGSATSSVTADDNKVPVAAIVVPLLLVFLGSAAALTSVWFWRKRRKAATEKDTNISNGQQNVTSGVSSGVSSGRISGTDRTYDLPEEGGNSTIDGNGLANSSCESDNYGYIVPVATMRADDTPEYEVPVHVDGAEEHMYSILDKVDHQ